MGYKKILLTLMIFCFIMTQPPFLTLYNKPEMVLGIPMFIVGIIGFSLMIPVLMTVMFFLDYRGQKK